LRNEYNEIGQLVDKKLHSSDNGASFKQSVDYRYNIRGWLTSMNDASLANNGTTNDDTGDLFGMNLGYNNDLGIGNTALFNGNISGITWSNSLGLSTTKQNAYVYTYDAMNRIQSSSFKEKAVSWTSPTNAALAETGYQYDLNGNITALQRNDRRASGWMDNLVYNYTGSGNQLKNVKDNGDAAAGFIDGNPSTTVDDYAYDANGNMVTDKNKSLTATNAIQYNHLNLPTIVTKGTGEFVKYTYDAGGRKLKQEVFNASSVVTKTTDYIGEYIYENNVLQFVNHEEGRIVTTGASPEYQYHLKDHLGNVRLTFTSKVDVVAETATLEDANAATEQSQFLRYANAKRVKATILDKTNGSSIGYAERLNGTTNEKYGLAKSISVMPGDVVNIEVYAKYIDTNSANWTGALTTLMSQITANTAGVVYDGGSYSSSTSSFNASYPGLLGTKTDNGAPKAYLNWLIFDRNYVSLTGGFKQITTAGKEAGTDVAHELVNSPAINITTAGYLYIWLSNENSTPVEVYFDDLKVTQAKSPVVATNDYYAFGMQSVSNSRENSIEQKYLYNNKELQDELNIGWLDYGARMYMSDIGRWGVHDEYSEIYFDHSPFNYVKNNPISAFDPNGKWVVEIVSTADKSGNISYSLSFTAEKGDDLNTLSSQLGVSKDEIVKAHPDLKDKDFKSGIKISLNNLGVVEEINNTMNNVASKQNDWNCANFAGNPNCSELPDQWTGDIENTQIFASQLKSQYKSVNEKQTAIGSVIHYRLQDFAKTRSYLLSRRIDELKSQGLSSAEIQAKLADPRTQEEILNLTNSVMANERHFSVVVLKDKSGCVQNIIQKAGQNPFTFIVNHVNEVSNVLPYAPTAIEGTKTPFYNKTKN
jgi:RHS repeat-associated protein